MQDEAQDFGIDWYGPSPIDTTAELVEIPHTECPIAVEDVQELHQIVPPLSQSYDYGLDLYEEALHFIYNRI